MNPPFILQICILASEVFHIPKKKNIIQIYSTIPSRLENITFKKFNVILNDNPIKISHIYSKVLFKT